MAPESSHIRSLYVFVIKVIIIFYISCSSLILYGQRNDIDDILLKFSEINISDKKNQKDTSARHESFVNNFNYIVNLAKSDGFNYLDNQELSKKEVKSIDKGIIRTFIHILQYKPELILNPEIISLLKIQVDNFQSFKLKYLKIPLKIFMYENNHNNSEIDNYLNLAIATWNITFNTTKE